MSISIVLMVFTAVMTHPFEAPMLFFNDCRMTETKDTTKRINLLYLISDVLYASNMNSSLTAGSILFLVQFWQVGYSCTQFGHAPGWGKLLP